LISSDSTPPHEASFDFEYNDQRTARLIERSIQPEVADLVDERSQTAVSQNERSLTVRIEATDLVALRAAMNTWLTLLDTAETVARTSNQQSLSPQ
jgi:KEOPS complex subunit Pcc1